MFRKSVVDKKVLNRRLLGWEKCLTGCVTRPSKNKKSCIFSLAKWPATSTPSGCFMLPLDAQRTYDDTQRCAMTSIHTPDHCTDCTPMKQRPEGSSWACSPMKFEIITDFPRKKSTLIVDRPNPDSPSCL